MKTPAINRRAGRSRLETILLMLGVLLFGAFVAALILPVFQARRNGHGRSPLYNIKTVGLATHNFASGNEGRLPPYLPGSTMDSVFENGTPDPEIKQPISYFTSLLVYLDYPHLHDKIDPSIPWDHPQNRDAYATRIETFEWPEDQRPYYDNDKTAAGYAIVHFSPNSRIISRPGEPFHMEDITDGAGQTVMLGTIDDSRLPAWGDPTNARDPADGFAGGPYAFGGFPEGGVLPAGGANVVFADGHASTLSADIDPKVAKALATPAGGEDVPDDSY